MSTRLKIGKISYLNLKPIFMALRELGLDEKYDFIDGYPSVLNRMLRHGELDISPSSSIEYLRESHAYSFLANHSISSMGEVRSILLFSRIPIENLRDGDIMATHQSETSIALLRIILGKFYGLGCKLRVTEEPLYEAIHRHSAYLAIGDDALSAYYSSTLLESECPVDCHSMRLLNHQAFFVYDIGQLWLMHTGLPAVFALWTYRKGLSVEKVRRIEELTRDLEAAKKHALENLDRYAPGAAENIPAKEVAAYWRMIIYDLTPQCMKGLEAFGDYLREIS